MALDEALMDAARAGTVTLRFYEWSPACLSFGRNQVARGRYDAERARERGIDIVRRPTGGRAVLHDREVTYSVAAPAGLWGGLREGYGRLNRALGRGLAALGVPLDPLFGRTRNGSEPSAPAAAAPPPLARACFRDPLPGELTSGGRKLVGSAQWRVDGALLQHGSILLHDDQPVVDELLIGATGAGAPPSGACSLHSLLGKTPSRERLLGELAKGFEEEFECRVEPGEPTTAELRAAEALQLVYRDPDWTWRR